LFLAWLQDSWCTPFIAGRQTPPAFAEAECPVDLVTSETWAQALVGTIKCYTKSFSIVLRVGFPLMLLAAGLGALAIQLVPPQPISRADFR
jgi:hypothetical protein